MYARRRPAAETWYYVYGYDSSGVLAVEASTTRAGVHAHVQDRGHHAPLPQVLPHDDRGVVLPFRAVNGATSTAPPVTLGASCRRALATGHRGRHGPSSSRTAGRRPRSFILPHARLRRLSSSLSARAEVTATFYTKGDSTTIRQEHADGIQAGMEFDIETDSSRTIRYTLTIGSAGSLQVRVIGFEE